MALMYGELTNRELEYLVISRDTTESDIKQRREILNGQTVYVDQPAVRAALQGSILVIDGVEKAERNILPILNNLLENREMQLDDGRFLVAPRRFDSLLDKYSKEELLNKKLERVSEDFRVIALGLPVPKFRGNPLDPPIRSRFQSRSVTSLPFNESLHLLMKNNPQLSSTEASALITFAQIINSEDSSSLGVPHFPEMSLNDLSLEGSQSEGFNVRKFLSVIYPHHLLPKEIASKVDGIVDKCAIDSPNHSEHTRRAIAMKDLETGTAGSGMKLATGYIQNTNHDAVLADLLSSYSMGADICLVGSKSCGKSTIARQLAALIGLPAETFIMYSDITARDLLQQRSTKPNGDTVWNNSALVEAAINGHLAVLDGLHHVDQSTLAAIQTLLHDREVTLFDGTKFLAESKFALLQQKVEKDEKYLNAAGVFKIPPSFRVLALAEPPGRRSASSNWLNSEVISMFHFHHVASLELEQLTEMFQQLFPSVERSLVSEICKFSNSITTSKDENLQTLSTSLSTKQIRRLLKLVQADRNIDVQSHIERAFMPQFLPSLPREAFYTFLRENFSYNFQTRSPNMSCSSSSSANDTQREFEETAANVQDESLVPHTLFYENEEQSKILRDLSRSFSLGEHLLLVGNQGVGKNKLVDKMLSMLRKPRQYIQLHRDTTVQSLTVQPNVREGKLVYDDSPLLKAVRFGHVLVIDEADKAPTHVTSVLKGLVEDSSMYLADGRKIVPPSTDGSECIAKTIRCHPNFRVIVLANRPGYPFLGNNFFASMGDLFSCHAIDNPGKESQMEMLRNYAPQLDEEIIERLVDAFDELREMSVKGNLAYPYSTRELVNIVKHLGTFPKDGVARAVQNVFDFDSFDDNNTKQVEKVLKRHGFPTKPGSASVHMAKVVPLSPMKLLSTLESDVSQPLSVKVSRLAQGLVEISNPQRLSLVQCDMQSFAPRSEFFQEQSAIWSIPLGAATPVCDMKASKVSENEKEESLYVATVNPSKFFVVQLKSKKLHECLSIDLSRLLDYPQISTFNQLNCMSLNRRNIVACFSRSNQILLLCDLANNSHRVLQLENLVNSDNKTINSVFRRPRTSSYSMVTNNFDSPFLLFHDSSNSNLLLIDVLANQVSRLELPFSPSSMNLISEDDVAVYDSNSRLHKLPLRAVRSGETESFMYKYSSSLHDKSLSCSDFFDANLVSEFLNGRKISSPAKLISGDKTQLGITVGFPDLDDGEVYGVARNNALKGVYQSTFLNPSFSAISLLDTRFVPKEALPEDLDLKKYPFAIEWINVRSKSVRYLPVPQSQQQHALQRFLPPKQQPLILTSDSQSYAYTCDMWGTIRQWEVNYELIKSSYQKWINMIGQPDEPIKIRHSQREATGPNHGKFDPTGNPHVGGNTWAGGSGGADTAGLGGVGGPYRLDLGHQVYQVPDEMKQNVPTHVLKAAKEMRDKAFKERLREIEMTEYEADVYNQFYNAVQSHINSFRVVIESLEARQKDREWTKHQSVGEFDDSKIVDSILGEKSVYKRRMERQPLPGDTGQKAKMLRLLVDVSGSMYRFNGHDHRLQRQLESVCMVMEALRGYEAKFKYDIIGHSGEDDSVELVPVSNPPRNEKERLQVLHTMHAHSQFCLSGDSTLQACSKAVKQLATLDADERFLILFSDANFARYGISPAALAREMLRERSLVHSFVIFIGSLGDEAELMRSQLPSQSAFVCMDTKDIPTVLRQILTSTILK